MELYCVKCKTKTRTTNLHQLTNKKNKPMISGNCNNCGSKKTSFVSQKQLGGFLPFLIPAVIAGAKALALGATGALGAKAIQKISGKGTKLPGKIYR